MYIDMLFYSCAVASHLSLILSMCSFFVHLWHLHMFSMCTLFDEFVWDTHLFNRDLDTPSFLFLMNNNDIHTHRNLFMVFSDDRLISSLMTSSGRKWRRFWLFMNSLEHIIWFWNLYWKKGKEHRCQEAKVNTEC